MGMLEKIGALFCGESILHEGVFLQDSRASQR
jgi:hypothetical protein